MFVKRQIERHQLPYVLKVYNRTTEQHIGYLGNASAVGLMIISELPLQLGPDYALQLRVPLSGGGFQFINLSASCLWCREDPNPFHYDAGFTLLNPPPEYQDFIHSLQQFFSFQGDLDDHDLP